MKKQLNEKLAVLIVNYDTWHHTINCLESIKRNAAGGNFKIFLIDNGSTNDSLARIESYLAGETTLPVELVHVSAGRGFSAGNNLGLVRALEQGFGYIMLLNNDTIITGDIFTAGIRFFREHPECSIIAGNTRTPDGEKELYSTRSRPSVTDMLFLYHTPFWNKPWFPGFRRHFMLDQDTSKPFPVYMGIGAALFFRRKYFDETGLFDEKTFLYFEEFIMGERARKAGMVTLFMPEPTLLHLGGQSTKKVSALKTSCFIAFCESEKYLFTEYYGYRSLRLFFLFLSRLLNYLYNCLRDRGYRNNLPRFLRTYFS